MPPIGVNVQIPVIVTALPSAPTVGVSHACTTHFPVTVLILLALLKPVEVQVVVVGGADPMERRRGKSEGVGRTRGMEGEGCYW